MTVNDRENGGTPGAEVRDPRLDRLYRETEHEGPPAHIDAAILAAARRGVGARPRPLSSALRRWRVPVSIAALVVLSVSLVTLVREEGGDELMKAVPSTPPAPKPSETAPPPAPQPAQADAARPSVQAPATRPEPARPAPRDDRRADAQVELGAMADRPRRESVTAAAPGAGTAAAPEPAAKPAVAAGAPAAEAESAKASARSIQSAVPGQVQPPPWQGFEKEPPQKWLDRIAELRRQGETAAAGEMLAEFKRRFPDHPVPPDLGTR